MNSLKSELRKVIRIVPLDTALDDLVTQVKRAVEWEAPRDDLRTIQETPRIELDKMRREWAADASDATAAIAAILPAWMVYVGYDIVPSPDAQTIGDAIGEEAE